MDERLLYIGSFQGLGSIWTKSGFLEAVKILLSEKNSLFESLINKLGDYPELKNMLYEILFHGGEVVYTIGLESIENAEMFGFVRKEGADAVVANRIFETILYNWFLSAKELQGDDLYKVALQDKNQFAEHGRLDMRRVLERFLAQFTELYGDCPQKFLEEEGRKYFLMFLRPIINGTGIS